MDAKDAYISQLENTIKSLQTQINNLEEMIHILRKEKFGPSSEKTHTSSIDGQISLFNEAEIEAKADAKEPIVHSVKGYLRHDSRTKREEIIKDLPVREVLCESAQKTNTVFSVAHILSLSARKQFGKSSSIYLQSS